ncbi:MAG TPA: hypothetical protein VNA28_02065 [Solirubrobacteraceae bacterium]|nr:hypothetical protein [Solirubrobacteraceae bacterium]
MAIIGLLALPAAASAGGWATVELSSTPDGLKPGATWNVEVKVMQHGRTPLSGVHPSVAITSGDVTRTFASRPTGKPGVHRVSVRFPQAGTWRYVVDDGFTMRHSYPPVQIGTVGRSAPEAAASTASGAIAYDRLALAALAGLAGAGLALGPRWRTRRQPATQGA